MGWARTLLLGDIGNRLDIADTEQGIIALQRNLIQNTHADRKQDDRLNQLEKENIQLKLGLSVLTNLLIKKNILDQNELSQIADTLDNQNFNWDQS